jgi:hypothetical protein
LHGAGDASTVEASTVAIAMGGGRRESMGAPHAAAG